MIDRWTALVGSALILGLALLVVVLLAHLITIQAQLDVACHGIIANLDLTEWVQLCKAG